MKDGIHDPVRTMLLLAELRGSTPHLTWSTAVSIFMHWALPMVRGSFILSFYYFR